MITICLPRKHAVDPSCGVNIRLQVQVGITVEELGTKQPKPNQTTQHSRSEGQLEMTVEPTRKSKAVARDRIFLNSIFPTALISSNCAQSVQGCTIILFEGLPILSLCLPISARPRQRWPHPISPGAQSSPGSALGRFSTPPMHVSKYGTYRMFGLTHGRPRNRCNTEDGSLVGGRPN
jgi:hypothetical protein